MQDETTCAAAACSERLQRSILDLLLTDRSPGPWTVDELGRAVGNPLAAGDAIAELHAFGLVHLFDAHVCPSRAAVRFDELGEVR
jgi:hypothetical protein